MQKSNIYMPFWITVAFGLLAIISPIVFTSPSISNRFDFTGTGPIGDTIGGLTAPIIGILNAVLLYITLKRQDTQIALQDYYRHEDKINELVDKKITLVKTCISALKISIKYLPKNAKHGYKLAEDITGQYEGVTAIEIIGTHMFHPSAPLLEQFEVGTRQWKSFFSQMNFAIIEASMALEANFYSRLPKHMKKKNYEYIMSQIIDIIILYNNAEKYVTNFPKDKQISTLDIRNLLSFHKRVKYLNGLDPHPELKEENQ